MGDTMIEIVAIGGAVAVLLLIGLHRRIGGMPSRLWAIARDEIARARGADDARADEVLREVVGEKAERLLSGVRAYHDKIAADLRAQLAAAEVRARAAERAATDMTTALETATTLVRELRGMLDDQRAPRPALRKRAAAVDPDGPDDLANLANLPELPDDDDARATIDIGLPRLAADDDEPEEEMTQVAKRPLAGTTGAPNGLRLASLRKAIPPPPSSSRQRAREREPR